MGCISQKGLCYSFGILYGLLSNKNIRNSKKKIFRNPPYNPINPILTGKWVNLVKSTLQTHVPENWGAKRSVPRARTRSEDPHRR